MIAIFVPSLMGAGLALSLAVVLIDLGRRVLPGTASHRLRVRRRRAIELVRPLTTALGQRPPLSAAPTRRRWPRAAYAVIATLGVSLGLYVATGSTANFVRPGGYVEGIVWLQALSLLASLGFLAICVATTVIAVRYDNLPGWAAWLVEYTPLGALDTATLRHPPSPRPLRDHSIHHADDAVAWFGHLRDAGRVLVLWPRSMEDAEDLGALGRQRRALAANGTNVLVVSPPGLRHQFARGFAPLLVVSDSRGRLLRHIAVDATPHSEEVAALLVESDGRVSWQRRGRPGRGFPMRSMWRAIRRERLVVLSPSDVIGPLVAGLVAAVFLGLGILAGAANGALLFWDRPLRQTIRDLPGAHLLGNVTTLGSRWTLGMLSIPLILLAWRRCRRFAITLACALPVGLALELLLKAIVDRPRPPNAFGFGASFPSGHVIAAVAFWGLLPPWTYLLTRRRSAWLAAGVVMLVVIVLVALSRVQVGAHWPSDVAGGVLIGMLFLLVAEWVVHHPVARHHASACPLHPARPTQQRGVLRESMAAPGGTVSP